MASYLVRVVCTRCGILVMLRTRKRTDPPGQVNFPEGYCKKCNKDIGEELIRIEGR